MAGAVGRGIFQGLQDCTQLLWGALSCVHVSQMTQAFLWLTSHRRCGLYAPVTHSGLLFRLMKAGSGEVDGPCPSP